MSGRPPADLRPMLATAGALPAGGGWAYEVKWDGFRALCRVEGSAARFVSRNGTDLTATYPELGAIAGALPADAVLDGEIVAFAEGRADFEAMRRRLRAVVPDAALRRAHPAAFVVFDVLWLGEPLVDRPWHERRAVLEQLDLRGPSWLTISTYDDGERLLAASRAEGLEGIVAKRRTSRYRPGARTTSWVKVKHYRTREVVVGGYVPNRAGGVHALLVGVPERPPSRLRYAGRVEYGFSDDDRRELAAALAPLRRADTPFASGSSAPDAVHVDPRLVVEVQFLEWTPSGHLRHASYKGVRPGHPAGEVARGDR